MKYTLTSALQIIVGLFGAFGAFLSDILPEAVDSRKFIYGITQFACLLVFLLLKIMLTKANIIQEKKNWKWFTLAMSALFIVFSSLYYYQQQNYLRNNPFTGKKMITGELTQRSLDICNSKIFKRENPDGLPCEEALLSMRTEDDIYLIYKPESVQHHTNLFVLYYIFLVIALSAAVFASIELIPKKQED
jgi:hypothetical protein